MSLGTFDYGGSGTRSCCASRRRRASASSPGGCSRPIPPRKRDGYTIEIMHQRGHLRGAPADRVPGSCAASPTGPSGRSSARSRAGGGRGRCSGSCGRSGACAEAGVLVLPAGPDDRAMTAVGRVWIVQIAHPGSTHDHCRPVLAAGWVGRPAVVDVRRAARHGAAVHRLPQARAADGRLPEIGFESHPRTRRRRGAIYHGRRRCTSTWRSPTSTPRWPSRSRTAGSRWRRSTTTSCAPIRSGTRSVSSKVRRPVGSHESCSTASAPVHSPAFYEAMFGLSRSSTPPTGSSLRPARVGRRAGVPALDGAGATLA